MTSSFEKINSLACQIPSPPHISRTVNPLFHRLHEQVVTVPFFLKTQQNHDDNDDIAINEANTVKAYDHSLTLS